MKACVSSALLLLSMFTAEDAADEMVTEDAAAQSESESTDMLIGTKVSARFLGYGSQPWFGEVVSRETGGKYMIEWIDGKSVL